LLTVYMHNISVQELQRQVKEHTPLVEALARNLARKLPAHVDAADLVQDGHVALINSILSTSRKLTSAHFRNYLAMRLHGAMLDGLRELDHGSRQLRKGMRGVELAIQRLGHRLGRMPLEHEVAMELGLSLRKYQRMLQDASDYALISLDDIMEASDVVADPLSHVDSDPLRVLERSALKESLASALKALSKQSSTVLRLYYVDDLKMAEIGLRLQCSEARVSQIHAQAIAELRARLLDGSGLIPVLKPRRSARAR
jgi:RNA polymerase sigma factor for flagellar operon FliA